MDAKAIVDVLWNAYYANNIISPILDDCRQLLTHFHQVHINHCFWQAIQCADGLARMSYRMTTNFLIYDSPPLNILDVFEGDLNGCILTGYVLNLVLVLSFIVIVFSSKKKNTTKNKIVYTIQRDEHGHMCHMACVSNK